MEWESLITFLAVLYGLRNVTIILFNRTDKHYHPLPAPSARQRKPMPKDPFLDDLIEVFGYAKGVDLYQKENVDEQDLETFTGLLDKFELRKSGPAVAGAPPAGGGEGGGYRPSEY